ncbi:spermatogenesis-defective protein 39 homolog [Physella acuta]|uniref:spermatogenesis-defective protein 39 homolog n=1 Tax=Physella acuta TaxID=109671 RepID=UPI0027DC6473|nr:spermatogenesis-defective protein 39 homolog [Physella acuta]XP_059147961.1 spermatogenesis-defective protein 39 homolog [Physella acuta]XP_059147962.1 spermatogenesis-defective protein 39 homolog [Physella acuta]XP_059147963.1 spermatogenesis-defective protein 39 homolog [Physella acuta]
MADERTRKKKFNFFDENVNFDAAKSIQFHQQNENDDDDDDDIETINFDDTPVIKYNNKPGGEPMPDLSLLATPANSTLSRTMSAGSDGPRKSSVAYGNVSSAMALSHSRSHSLTIGHQELPTTKATLHTSVTSSFGSEKDQSLTSSNLSLTNSVDIEEVTGSGSKKLPSAAEIERMQQEIQSLKRSLLSAKKDRWMKLPIEDTLWRIRKGEEFSLEMYKSLEDKLELLDKAIKVHDGNAITAAVLFLKRSVTQQIFRQVIRDRPAAANHYLKYLKSHFDYGEFISTLVMLGRKEEAAMYAFKFSLTTTDIGLKIAKLKECLREHFSNEPALQADANLVKEYIDLLERQRPIEEFDASTEAAGRSTLFKDFPRKRSLLDMPVVTTLYYCCLYHFDLAENAFASPVALKKRHEISDKQFTWTAISARAKLRQWKDVEALLTTKGWFGGPKMKAIIGFDKVIDILHRNSSPPEVFEKYLSMIDDLEMRLSLAKKVKCNRAVVDTLIALKKRTELEEFSKHLDRYSKDGLYAHDALNSSTIRWK